MTIIISKNGKNAKIMEPTGFAREDTLQQYIHDNPESIPLYELSDDKKLFIIAREFPTKSGPIDAIGIDQDGDVYIVETKLYKNPDKRTVIAQALDYGASLWKHSTDFQELLNRFDNEVHNNFDISFTDKLLEFFNLSSEQVELLIDNIQANFKDGNFKFVILMDHLGKRLKDLIIYVNQNSKFDIYGVQFKYYNVDSYEIIIPKIFGIEIKKDITPNTKKVQWNHDSFMSELKTNFGVDFVRTAEEILSWASDNQLQIKWGSGKSWGTFYPIITASGKSCTLFGVFTTGKVEIDFKHLLCDYDTKLNLLTELNEIDGINIPTDQFPTWRKFPIESIMDKASFKKFKKCFEKIIGC